MALMIHLIQSFAHDVGVKMKNSRHSAYDLPLAFHEAFAGNILSGWAT